MSKTILETPELSVTSFCGPASTLERTRMRLQINVLAPEGYASLGYNDVKDLQVKLDRWLSEHNK